MMRSLPVLAIFSAAWAMSAGCHELAFLDVDCATGTSRGDKQIGLAAEERGDLEDIDDLGGDFSLRRFVNVGQDRDAEFANFARIRRPSCKPGPR